MLSLEKSWLRINQSLDPNEEIKARIKMVKMAQSVFLKLKSLLINRALGLHLGERVVRGYAWSSSIVWSRQFEVGGAANGKLEHDNMTPT